MADKVALRQAVLRVLRFLPVRIIILVFHTHLRLILILLLERQGGEA